MLASTTSRLKSPDASPNAATVAVFIARRRPLGFAPVEPCPYEHELPSSSKSGDG